MTAIKEKPPKPEYALQIPIPETPAIKELAGHKQWLTWDYRWDEKKWTKPPLHPNGDFRCDPTAKKTLVSFDEAVRIARTRKRAGIGFSLQDEDGLTGIDLDGCRNPATGEIDIWAAEIVDLGETYWEVTPSGRGIRAFVRGKIPDAIKRDKLGVEMYAEKRYLTITGEVVPGSVDFIGAAPKTIEALHRHIADLEPVQEPEKVVPLVRNYQVAVDPNDRIAEVQSALSVISAESYHDWIKIGMALENGLGQAGKAIWEDWSATSEKYNPRVIEEKWRSFRGNGVTMASIFQMANATGWRWIARRDIDPNEIAENNRLAARFIERHAQQAPGAVQAPAVAGTKAQEDPFGPDVRAMAAKLKFPRYQCKDPKAIPPRDWLYGKHLIRKYVSARFAAGATGKTQLCLTEALAMVTGKPLLGMDVKRPFNVLVWNGEDPQEEVDRRFEATRFYYGITPEDIKGRLFLVSGRDFEMKLARTVERSTLQILEPIVDAMTAFIRAEEIDVAMFDPFISSHSVPENDNTMIDAVVKEWGKIAEFGNCSIELVHHMRKGNGHERTVEDGRGASALKDAARDAQLLVKASADEAAAIGAEEGQEWRYFRIGDSKSNMAPPVNKATWFKLESVNLGNGTDENPADEVGVVTRIKPKSIFEDVSRDLLEDVFRELRVGQGQRYDKRSPAWFGRLVASKLDLDHEKDRDKRRIEGMIEQWRKSGAIVIEARRDTKQGRDLEWVVCGNWFEE